MNTRRTDIHFGKHRFIGFKFIIDGPDAGNPVRLPDGLYDVAGRLYHHTFYIRIVLLRLFMPDMAIQAIVPMMAAARAERKAISSVVPSASRIEMSSNRNLPRRVTGISAAVSPSY